MDSLFKSQRRLAFTTSLVALTICSCVTPSFAGGGWGQQHPRRAEVLVRDNRINNRLNSDRGYLGGNYGQLKTEDRAIRQQEQADARFNGGYITKGEQRQLNHEENQLNHQIRNDYDPYQQTGTGGGYPGHGYPGGGGFPGHGYPGGGYPGGGYTGGGYLGGGYPGGGYTGGGYPGGINPGGTVTPISYPGGVVPTGGFPGGGNFAQNHPRRAEVLGRDANLNNQVQADRGDLSGHYNQLNREDSAIRRQEQADARFNGGYITPGEQKQLNREENHVQNQINRDLRP